MLFKLLGLFVGGLIYDLIIKIKGGKRGSFSDVLIKHELLFT